MYDYCTFDIEGLVVFVDGTKHILSRYWALLFVSSKFFYQVFDKSILSNNNIIIIIKTCINESAY